MLIAMHGMSRAIGHRLCVLLIAHRAAGATDSDLVILMMKAFDDLPEDRPML